MKNGLFSALLPLFLLVWGCKQAERPSSSFVYPDHPSVQLHNWDQGLLKRPLAQRILPISDLAASYVLRWNELDHFEEKPVPAEMSPALRAAFLKELALLPESVRRFMDEHLFAIYTCENLGGSAMAGVILDQDRAVGGFLMLDVGVLGKPANDWISFKENTVFAPVDGLRYRVEIEEPSSNTVAAGARFILVHELGHILGQVKHVTAPFSGKQPVLTDFMRQSFIMEDGKILAADAPWAKQIEFYRKKPPLSLADAEALYRKLSGTRLPTLYAATEAEEDWAETFALYVHCVLLKKHYRVFLEDKGRTKTLASDLILSDSMKEKRAMVERALR